MTAPVLSIRDLSVRFKTPDGLVQAVTDVSYEVHAGEILGVVGESGSGKSVTVSTILGLIPQPPGEIEKGQILFGDRDLLRISPKELRQIRGGDIAMIFQDPMTSLNPVFTVGEQIGETIAVHHPDLSNDDIRRRSVELLEMVGVPDPEARHDQYPHEYSGGMRQRAMTAIAIANEPKVLIADEPTTALDVTIQAQVLDVLQRIQGRTHAGMILITHDLGLIAEMADRVVVMYGGRVVEVGDVEQIFHRPRHPYTVGLIASLPRLDTDLKRLEPIPGSPPSLIHLPPGCSFHPRCRLRQGREVCRTDVPPLYDTDQPGHVAACHFHDEVDQEIERVRAATGAKVGGQEPR